MIILGNDTSELKLVTSSAADIDVSASWVDKDGAAPPAIEADALNTAIASATTTTVVPAAAAGSKRNVVSCTVRNKHASLANTVKVVHDDGTTAVELLAVTLAAGATLQYADDQGWSVLVDGQFATVSAPNGPAGGELTGTYPNPTLAAAYQPLDADLTSIAGLGTAADKLAYTTGAHVWAEAAFTSAGRALIDDADAAAQRTTLGLGTAATQASSAFDAAGAANAALVAAEAYTDSLVVGLLDFKGSTSCSGNPDYPAGLKGDSYYVSSAGKIGGASGKSVEVGDVYVASADNAGGTEASVGTSWFVLEHNLVGAMVGSNNLSEIASASTARSNLGLGTLATQSGTFSGTSSGTNTGDAGTVTAVGHGAGIATSVGGNITTAGNILWAPDTFANNLVFWDGANSSRSLTADLAGTDVVLTFSSGALAITGALTATNLSGTNTGDQDLSAYLTSSAAAAAYQPLDADLTSLAALGSAADKLAYTTGAHTWAETAFTAAGRALIDDADAAAQRATLGLGTLATQSGTFSGTSSGTNTGDQDLSAYAALASPTFTGDPKAPTASPGDNDTSLATTAFVTAAVAAVPAGGHLGGARQCVLTGAVDSNGLANFLTVGSGLRPGLSATATPLAITFANGFDSTGAVDTVSRLTADASDPLGANLPVRSTSYVWAAYSSSSAVTYGQALVPPQYGEAYDRTRAALLHFEAADTTTSMIDDYGNTWTAAGNAQIATAQFKFSTASLMLDGTGDYIESTNLYTGFSGAWTTELWVRWNTLPGTGTDQFIVSCVNNSFFLGLILSLNNTSGTRKLKLLLTSSTSGDLASSVLGTSTTWAANTWYHLAVVFDQLAGKYFVYKDGVAEAALTITSALRLYGPINQIRLGDNGTGGTNQLNGWIDEFRLSPCCRYPNGTTFTPPAGAFSAEGHFYSIPEMKMYEVTSASATAGVNPGMTRRDRVFLGEADTGASTVSAVRSYAYRGRYVGPWTFTLPAAATSTVFNHNIGIPPAVTDIMLENVLTDQGYVTGDRLRAIGGTTGYGTPQVSANSGSFYTAATVAFKPVPKGGGASVALSGTSWKYRFEAQRGW